MGIYKVHRKTYGLLFSLLNKPFGVETLTSSRKFGKTLIVVILVLLGLQIGIHFLDASLSGFIWIYPSDYSGKCKLVSYFNSQYDHVQSTLEKQIKLQHDAMPEHSPDSQILPITSQIIEQKSFICPMQPPNLVGEGKINTDLETIDEDIRKSSVDLENRVKSIKYFRDNAPPAEDSDQLKADTEESAIPSVDELPVTLNKPPLGVVSLPNCVPHRKTAIVIPYRDRLEHLKLFLRHMHKFLENQDIEYGIYVINLAGRGKFNRAKLLNIGFREALLHYGKYDCIIFHDVDLLPENDHNLYTCGTHPMHMSLAINIFDYKLPYDNIFGGVTAMTPAQFHTVNGYSNQYWGWGGEDDDMYMRIDSSCMTVSRITADIAKYTMIFHTHEKGNEIMPERKSPYECNGPLHDLHAVALHLRFNLLKGTVNRKGIDGMSSLEYQVVNRSFDLLYNNITVLIGEPKDLLDGLTLMQHTLLAGVFLLALWAMIFRNDDARTEKM